MLELVSEPDRLMMTKHFSWCRGWDSIHSVKLG